MYDLIGVLIMNQQTFDILTMFTLSLGFFNIGFIALCIYTFRKYKVPNIRVLSVLLIIIALLSVCISFFVVIPFPVFNY